MNHLIKRIQDQQVRDVAYMYSKGNNKLEDEIILSMASAFINDLPYSMDIKQEEYIPADFINMTPYDLSNHKTFWEDYKNVYDALINFGETFSSGLLIQACAVFQKMLEGQIPNNYALQQSDFLNSGIGEMTDDKEYNESFFEILKTLPEYYKKVQETKNNEARRDSLVEIYTQIKQRIGNRVGGYKETNEEDEIVEEVKPMVILHPRFDLEMLYNSYNIKYNARDRVRLIQLLKEQAVNKFSLKMENRVRSLESNEERHS